MLSPEVIYKIHVQKLWKGGGAKSVLQINANVLNSVWFRSMEAHSFLQKKGFNIRSYGTGEKIKIPGIISIFIKKYIYSFLCSKDLPIERIECFSKILITPYTRNSNDRNRFLIKNVKYIEMNPWNPFKVYNKVSRAPKQKFSLWRFPLFSRK